jgi:hypothetical protein
VRLVKVSMCPLQTHAYVQKRHFKAELLGRSSNPRVVEAIEVETDWRISWLGKWVVLLHREKTRTDAGKGGRDFPMTCGQQAPLDEYDRLPAKQGSLIGAICRRNDSGSFRFLLEILFCGVR